MSIGENVRRIRIECGMPQKDLALAVEVEPPMISMVERDTRALSLPLACKIAKVLGCSVMDFLDDKSV